MKKLALFLALCLLMQAVGLTAFAEKDAGEIPDAAGQAEELIPEEEFVLTNEPVDDEAVQGNNLKDNGDAANFVLDDQDCICEYNGTMTAIVLPTKVNGVTVQGITETAFSGNTTIQSIAIPATGYSIIENGAFRNCTSLESVSMANPVSSIVAEAFMGCTALKAISWPSGLKEIEHDAFNGCTALKAIGMTTNLEEIGDNAFRNCSSLVDFDMEDSNSLTTIGSSAFYGCSSMKAIILPKNLTTIKNSAFENCKAATKLTLPNGLTRIESYTFKNCSSLKNVTIKDNVTYIGQEAFYNCSGLDWVLFPKGVINILKNAFTGISANTVLFMRHNYTKLKISKDGLGTSGIIVGIKNKTPHAYTKTHSGVKFLTVQAENYILRCYTYLLNRSATFTEQLTQIRNLALGKLTAATLVKSIATSAECVKKKWNNTQFIRKLYRAMLNRSSNPTDSEIAVWKKCLRIGMTIEGVINGIAKSEEHKKLCKKILLTPGTVINANYRDRDQNITFFVHNAYRYAYYKGVSKKVTIQDLESGCNNLIVNAWSAYKFLHSLVSSKTFTEQKMTNKNYVNTLYRIYLNRLPSDEDRDFWVNQLTAKNKSRAWVEEKFAESKEFVKLMKKINLTAK